MNSGMGRTSLANKATDNIINRLYCQREIENIREVFVKNI